MIELASDHNDPTDPNHPNHPTQVQNWSRNISRSKPPQLRPPTLAPAVCVYMRASVCVTVCKGTMRYVWEGSVSRVVRMCTEIKRVRNAYIPDPRNSPTSLLVPARMLRKALGLKILMTVDAIRPINTSALLALLALLALCPLLTLLASFVSPLSARLWPPTPPTPAPRATRADPARNFRILLPSGPFPPFRASPAARARPS
jgi:hypothetical protein